MDDVGVGDAMREVTPATHRIRLNKDGAAVDLGYEDGRADYCPRREHLDGLLQDAAVAAGAELHDQTRVTTLVRDEDRVAGVRAVSDGVEQEFRAELVVGADGRHSTVAKLVDADEYLAYDAPRAMYWNYWDAPAFWHTDPAYPFDMYIGHVGDSIRTIFQTDHGHLLLGSLPPVSETKRWRDDPLGTLKADLASDSVVGPLVESADPDGKVRGTIKERYFFRNGTGPGWVLVGDAGHHKDFVLGDGITEALLQARSLTKAIQAGTDGALVRWWRERDVEALPLYFFAEDEGALGAPAELERVVFSQVAKRADLKERMANVLERKVSPYATFPIGNLIRWTLGGALTGKWRVLGEFFAKGRRASTVNREWTARKKLLAELDGELERQ